MPRNQIDPGVSLEYLSILDLSGEADEDLVPQISDGLLLRGYRTMVGRPAFR